MKLLYDFFPILLFFITYKIYGIFAATAVAIIASFVQVGGFWWKHRRFETMHLVTLGIIVVFGGATLLLQDRTFIMWKPSILNWMFGIVFLASQFIGEKPLVKRMMGANISLPDSVWLRLNIMWILFFLLMGCINLYVANLFFIADAAWREAAGISADTPVHVFACAELASSQAQSLCSIAETREQDWVNFKLFGMLGATLVFVFAQAIYMSRYIEDEEETDGENS